MNRSLAFVIAVACVVFSAMPVQAADVPARTNPPSFYKAPWELPFSWTGFYTGINGGYAWGHSSWSDPAVGTDSGNFNISGGLVGGQLGYNWQTGPVVLGIETDADWMSVKGNTAGLGGVCPADGGGQCQVQQSWVGTTRAQSRLRIQPLAALCHGRRRLRQHPSGAANWHLHQHQCWLDRRRRCGSRHQP